MNGTGVNQKVAVNVKYARRLFRQKEPQRVAPLRYVLFEPRAKDGFHVVGIFGKHEQRKPAVPAVGTLGLREFVPRIGLPELAKHDDAEIARDFLRATDDITQLGC